MSSDKKINSLLAIQGPTQFIAAYVAFCWCNENVYKEKSDATLLIYDTSVSPENEFFFQDSIRKLAGTTNFREIIFIDEHEMSKISKVHYRDAIVRFKENINEEHFDYIYLARSFGSFGTKLISDVYSKSFKIEYGDSFGLVGNEKYIEMSYLDILKKPIISFKMILKRHIYQQYHKKTQFDLTVLSMPLIWDSKYLNNKTVIIPNKIFVKGKFSQISDLLLDLQNYCRELLVGTHEFCNLYLLSNFYNSGFCTLENEVNLYKEVILRTATLKQRIILKNHPRGSQEVLSRLKVELKDSFDVKIIDNADFSFMPIELWKELLNRCMVFPVFSSSSISLKYLYSTQVQLTLDSKTIKKFIYYNKIQEVATSEKMCKESIDILATWDEKHPIWIKE